MDFRQARRRAVEQGEQNKRRLEGILEKVQCKWDHILQVWRMEIGVANRWEGTCIQRVPTSPRTMATQ